MGVVISEFEGREITDEFQAYVYEVPYIEVATFQEIWDYFLSGVSV